MASDNEWRVPAGENDGLYIVDCSFLAMLAAVKSQRVGASLKTTGKDEPAIENAPRGDALMNGEVASIPASDGIMKRDEGIGIGE